MNKRASYLTQILEKIGLPLMEALIVPVAAKADAGGDMNVQIAQDTEAMAQMLTCTVAASIDLAGVANIEALGENSDSLRVALSAITAPLVAKSYAHSGKVPDESSVKQLTAAMQGVVKFSENFSAGLDEITRLSALEASGAPMDKHQLIVQYLQALSPIIIAGADTQVIAGKITDKANAITKSGFGEIAPADHSRIALAVTRTLAQIYAACRAEKPDATPDDIWNAFELRVAVLNGLAQAIVPSDAGGINIVPKAQVTTDSMVVTPAVAPVSPPPTATPLPVAETPADPPPVTAPVEEKSAEAPASGGSPMGFFTAKKPEESMATPAVPPSIVEKPAEAPPVAPSDVPSAAEAPPSGGGPMGFFAAKKKDEDTKE